jgi:hypothetical protein
LAAYGDLATFDVFFGALYVHFANDLSTAKLSESKYAHSFKGGLMLSGRSGFLGIDFMLKP